MLQPKGSIIELCQVTRDLDRAIDHWVNVVGAGPFFVFEIPPLPGHTYRGEPSKLTTKIGFGFSGGLLIELLEPVGDVPSIYKEMLDSKGEGFHHIFLREDFDTGAQRLKSFGYEIAFSGAMPTGERIAVFDTREGNGGYIELMDTSPTLEALLETMHQAHLDWDGSHPKRDLFTLISPEVMGAAS